MVSRTSKILLQSAWKKWEPTKADDQLQHVCPNLLPGLRSLLKGVTKDHFPDSTEDFQPVHANVMAYKCTIEKRSTIKHYKNFSIPDKIPQANENQKDNIREKAKYL